VKKARETEFVMFFVLHGCGKDIFLSRFIVPERAETRLSSLAVFLFYVNREKSLIL